MVFEGLTRRHAEFDRPQGIRMEMLVSQYPHLLRGNTQVGNNYKSEILNSKF